MGGKSYPVGGGQTLRLGRWTHLAATYDRAHLNLYRNGVELASVPASGRLGSSRGPLRIGGNSIAGEWFKGVIDDVRIYNRALTPAEIQRDMRRSVGRPARSAAPAPAPAPSGPGPFSFGIVTTRGIEHIDDARKLGARITRIHFDIHTPVADMREFVGRAASQGVEVILLAAFEDGGIPSADEARGLGAWAREFGPGGTFWQGRSDGAYASRYIEFGNETSYSYQGTQNEGGAVRPARPRRHRGDQGRQPARRAAGAGRRREHQPQPMGEGHVQRGAEPRQPRRRLDGAPLRAAVALGAEDLEPDQPDRGRRLAAAADLRHRVGHLHRQRPHPVGQLRVADGHDLRSRPPTRSSARSRR